MRDRAIRPAGTYKDVMTLDLLSTMAVAGLVITLGEWLCRRVAVLSRFSVPPPVVGGLVVAVALALSGALGAPAVSFDTTLQQPLLITFFASIGFAARIALLRLGGPQVLRFWGLCTAAAIAQSLVGILVAVLFGLPLLFGVLVGVVTLSGGPATGMAFAPAFEAAGVGGAGAIAVASAMSGIVLGGLLGGPTASSFIRRHSLATATPPNATPLDAPTAAVSSNAAGGDAATNVARLTGTLATLLVVIALGALVSGWIGGLGVTLPAYIGAMAVAALVANLPNGERFFSPRVIDIVGQLALSWFLAMWLMTLDLRKLDGLAWPLITNLVLQAALLWLVLGVVWRVMGRDYDAAVMGGGFVGFMLGTTATALAVMRTLVVQFGAAPRALLVAPLVGAFFIDFTNAFIITVFLNLLA